MMAVRVSSAAILLLTIQATMWSGVRGSCYFARSVHLEEHTGKTYCTEPASKERIPLDEYLVTSDCFNCTCHSDVLQCCGIGIRAGFIGAPPGKQVVEDPDCGYHFEDVPPK